MSSVSVGDERKGAGLAGDEPIARRGSVDHRPPRSALRAGRRPRTRTLEGHQVRATGPLVPDFPNGVFRDQVDLLGSRSLVREGLFFQQVNEFFVRQARLADDTSDNGFGQIEALVVRDSHASGFGGVFEVDVRAGLLVDVKTALLQGAENLSGFEGS